MKKEHLYVGCDCIVCDKMNGKVIGFNEFSNGDFYNVEFNDGEYKGFRQNIDVFNVKIINNEKQEDIICGNFLKTVFG